MANESMLGMAHESIPDMAHESMLGMDHESMLGMVHESMLVMAKAFHFISCEHASPHNYINSFIFEHASLMKQKCNFSIKTDSWWCIQNCRASPLGALCCAQNCRTGLLGAAYCTRYCRTGLLGTCRSKGSDLVVVASAVATRCAACIGIIDTFDIMLGGALTKC